MSVFTQGANERFHGLDVLRAFAMFLGISLHASIGFMQGPPFPYPMNEQRNLFFDIHNLAIHSFRMQLFFLVAGFFAHLVFQRSGPKQFFKQRLQRIGIPLVAGFFLLLPVTWIILGIGMAGSWEGALAVVKKMGTRLGHLWFLYYMLMFYVATWIFHSVIEAMAPKSWLVQLDKTFTSCLKSGFRPLLFAGATFFVYLFTESWADIGLPMDLKPMPRVLFYYGIFFFAGWFLHRNLHCMAAMKRNSIGLGVASLVFLVTLIFLMPLEKKFEHPNYLAIKITALFCYNLLTWSAIFFLSSLALKWFDKPSERARYWADASYWCYLVHLPIVFGIHVWVRTWKANPFVGYIFNIVVTVLILAVSYRYLVRYTFIGRTLNGPRARPLAQQTFTNLGNALAAK